MTTIHAMPPFPSAFTRRPSYAILLTFSAAAALLIPFALWLPGLVAWGLCAALLAHSRDRVAQRRMGALLAAVLLLAVIDIRTDLTLRNALQLGGGFLGALLLPLAVLWRERPRVIEFRIIPRHLDRLECAYVLISVPLAWAVVSVYFFQWTPQMPLQWPLAGDHSHAQIARFITGINCVGIWDELFFINTVYAVLRSLYPARAANLAQAVVYTSVLYDMAFIGAGPVIVFLFALIQGVMYERARTLLYVLVVHLIVDAFLVAAVLHYHFPGLARIFF
jgi:membrane protease YdiL (CAAX protease family)